MKAMDTPVNDPGMQLPPPVPDQSLNNGVPAPVPNAAGQTGQPPVMPASAPPASPGLPAAAAAPVSLPLPPQSAPNAPTGDVAATTAGAPGPMAQVVDDGDLIEKEWVSKAKQIVEQTRNDPFKQSEELTVFKADYMKKRYDKNIKLNP